MGWRGLARGRTLAEVGLARGGGSSSSSSGRRSRLLLPVRRQRQGVRQRTRVRVRHGHGVRERARVRARLRVHAGARHGRLGVGRLGRVGRQRRRRRRCGRGLAQTGQRLGQWLGHAGLLEAGRLLPLVGRRLLLLLASAAAQRQTEGRGHACARRRCRRRSRRRRDGRRAGRGAASGRQRGRVAGREAALVQPRNGRRLVGQVQVDEGCLLDGQHLGVRLAVCVRDGRGRTGRHELLHDLLLHQSGLLLPVGSAPQLSGREGGGAATCQRRGHTGGKLVLKWELKRVLLLEVVECLVMLLLLLLLL